MGELTGKPVVVTGAGRGLGRAYALAIAEAGGQVLANDRDEAAVRAVVDEIRAKGGTAESSGEPVGTAASGEAIVAQCVDRFGSIHGLINNAAVHSNCPTIDESPDNAERLVQINVLGTYFTGAAALKRMLPAKAGVIVNIGSGAMLGVGGQAIYAATKSAHLALTTSWAKEVEGSGVTILGISPWARTPMLLSNPSEFWSQHGPEVAAPLAVFLLTDRARHLHGQMVRTAEGEISLYTHGGYGPILGQRLDWTVEALDETLRDQRSDRETGFMPQRANT